MPLQFLSFGSSKLAVCLTKAAVLPRTEVGNNNLLPPVKGISIGYSKVIRSILD
jgi:hypothetical protein